MKKILVATLLMVPMMAFVQTTATSTSVIVGGDRDAHGCIPSAGYVWDALLNKCVRPWEQKASSTVNVACVSAAVEKRENSLIAAHDTFNASIKSALEARKTALKDAWTASDKQTRKQKQQAAYKAFKTSGQAAHSALRTARSSAWNVFSTDMKACGVKDHSERAQEFSSPTSSL